MTRSLRYFQREIRSTRVPSNKNEGTEQLRGGTKSWSQPDKFRAIADRVAREECLAAGKDQRIGMLSDLDER
jgi:hypothetical protein